MFVLQGPPLDILNRRVTHFALIAGAAIALCARTAGAAEADTWYDARPLLGSLRPALVPALSSGLDGRPLEALPLYDLDLSFQPDSASFQVSETLYFTNPGQSALPDLVLRVYANVGRPQGQELVQLLDAACLGRPCSLHALSESAWRISFPTPLLPKQRARLVVHLRGHLEIIPAGRTTLLGQGLEGLTAFGNAAATSYGLLATADGIASLANFYAVLAPRRAEQWRTTDVSALGDLGGDEIANVRASVSVPSDWQVAHVGSVLETLTTLDADGPGRHRKVLKISAALVRDFALVLASGFDSASRTVSGVELNSYFRPSERQAGEQVLDVASVALRDYERRFATYPYARLDLAEAPLVGGAGGVEFSGLAAVGSVFYKRLSSPALESSMGGAGSKLDPTSAMREFITAHEVAHQWWHVLVGSDSREHPFTDEGLAQYSTLLYFEDRYGAARASQESELNLKLPYRIMRLLGQKDAAVERSVASFATPAAYSALVYGKGPLLYPEIRRRIGDGPFFDAIKSYARRFAFQVAPARAVFDGFSARDRPAVSRLVRRWLDETHGDEDLGQLELSALAPGLFSGATSPFSAPKNSTAPTNVLPAQLLDALRQMSGAVP